jgi:hypothetical protein
LRHFTEPGQFRPENVDILEGTGNEKVNPRRCVGDRFGIAGICQ